MKRHPSEKSALDPSAPAKILLLRLRRIGDIVLTTPALTALKQAFPHASLTYVVESPYRRLVEGNPALDSVIAVEPKLSALDSWRLIRRIRREHYDAVLDFHGGPRTSLWTFLSGARVKVGYLIRGRGWPYDKAIPRRSAEGPVHSAENHLNLVRALGARIAEPPRPFLPPALAAEKARVDKFFRENRLRNFKAVVLHIGAGNSFRDWGLERLTGLAHRLAAMPGVRVVLAGGDSDLGRAEEMIGRGSLAALSLVGELNLIELRELIGRAALFVGPDSGPAHIAASTSTPAVVLFGPTLPAHFAPWRGRVTLIEKRFDCRPCKQRECRYGDFRCLQSISADEVLKACRPFLRRNIPKK